jgi:hypothetical protein
VTTGSGSTGSIKVDIGRASAVAVVMAVLVFAALGAGGVYAALDSAETGVRVIGYVIAGLSGLMLLAFVTAIPRLLKRRGLEFDGQGVHFWYGQERLVLPWPEVAAVGIGYEQPPGTPSLPLSVQDAIKDYVADKVKDAVKLDGKRSIAVEIFPADPAAAARHPILARYRREQPAPAAGLPGVRWRLPLPPVVGVARGVERGVRTFQEQRWLGWFARPWTGGLVR